VRAAAAILIIAGPVVMGLIAARSGIENWAAIAYMVGSSAALGMAIYVCGCYDGPP
jgi:hypothetical protein